MLSNSEDGDRGEVGRKLVLFSFQFHISSFHLIRRDVMKAGWGYSMRMKANIPFDFHDLID